MNNRLLFVLIILSLVLTSLKVSAVPAEYMWIAELLKSVGDALMLAVMAYKNPDGSSARLPYVARLPKGFVPKRGPEDGESIYRR